MQNFDPARLPWLLPPIEELRARLKSLTAEAGPVNASDVLPLVRTALDLDQLIQLDKAMGRIGERFAPGTLSQIRLALLVDGTTEYIAPAIRASGLRHGVVVETYTPAYGQALTEAMMPDSGLVRFGADAALVASDYRSLGLGQARMDAGAAQEAVAAALTRLGTITAALVRLGITPILQTLPAPPEPWTGHLDQAFAGSPAAQISAVNAGIIDLVHGHGGILFDGESLAGLVGRANWFDHGYWNRAKVPFSFDLVPLYADHIARILGAIRGKSRKCLVLDLDNTCWGGIIGDDGVEGIRIGQGSADGESFLAIQAYALSLKARGVVLAVVSKNEDDAARLPFRKHPDMLLREDDIAVFLANWNDKATNIAHVAKSLNIGIDALAFLDDNPAERTRVRQMLPEVFVPEVPADPAGYPAALAWSGMFETVGLSADDAHRAAQYQDNAKRAQALEQIGDYDAYLRSMEMVCDIRPFDGVGRTRIAQLVNKSNQFNLTSRRYTETDIASFETDPATFDIQIRLTDRFGDNGMISVVIFRKSSEEWLCDTWLMSCRVLERRVEEAVLAHVAAAARAAGARRLTGEYIPTAKNRMVAGHFGKLGFAPAGDLPGVEGGTRWVLELDSYQIPELPMTLTGRAAPTTIAGGTEASAGVADAVDL